MDPTTTRSAIPGTQLDLDPIRNRSTIASPGPWRIGGEWLQPWEVTVSDYEPVVELSNHRQGIADAQFIANARTDVPVLLAELDRARDTLRFVESLLYNTDGNPLGDGAEIPAGELARMLYDPDPQPS